MKPVGFIMMCHTALHRAAQVVRFWAASGAPVVIHVDARVSSTDFAAFQARLADLADVSFTRRYKCDWGKWSLVAATLAGAEQMLAKHDVGHVCLVSGSCLPLRPTAELVEYLAERPTTDFIESVTTEEVGWTVGGIDMERFTLRFPFSWKTQRRLFDGYVRLQRRLRVKRRIPQGLTPHLGSQWWCLSRATLQAILSDPDRPAYDRYFRRVWIPDESYFQSLARRHSERIESRSLTLAKFDDLGKPYIFYDDHLHLLRRSDCFIARKIWSGASDLYDAFLAHPDAPVQNRAEPKPSKIESLFAQAVDRRQRGRPGLYMQSRFPRQDHENGKTCAPYSMFQGFSDLFENFESWLTKHAGARVHGHLFAPARAEFAGGAPMFAGGLPNSAALRDYNPRAFLANVIWNARGERQCFMFSPRDTQAIDWFTATDPNAQISVITGAWAVPLFRAGGDFPVVRARAAKLQKIETRHLKVLRSMYVKARVRIWTMAEFVENPMEPLQAILDEINPRHGRSLTEAPQMADLTGFGQFLQDLRNGGMQPRLMGDFSVNAPSEIPRPRHLRAKTVK